MSSRTEQQAAAYNLHLLADKEDGLKKKIVRNKETGSRGYSSVFHSPLFNLALFTQQELLPAATELLIHVNRGVHLLHPGFDQFEAGLQRIALCHQHLHIVCSCRLKQIG